MATSTPAPQQQGGQQSGAQQQGQSGSAPSQQQGSTPVIRDWASI